MRNISISIDDEIYRRARLWAAEPVALIAGWGLSALRITPGNFKAGNAPKIAPKATQQITILTGESVKPESPAAE